MHVNAILDLKGHSAKIVNIIKLEICPKNCNDKGDCLNGECKCKKGWSGLDCSIEICKNNCNNNGICVDQDKPNGKCDCFKNYFGI